ncbi:RhoGAP_domain-containing protein [Hexamita inflata]|uniref:RhoGAP domain-containing protein n=1 Tax=Hexamita inflata TaxID=28002 RepID=A0AA86R3L6_9EUKA|nr:RhoGAP domain-containing protein [Hexamita inflata]
MELLPEQMQNMLIRKSLPQTSGRSKLQQQQIVESSDEDSPITRNNSEQFQQEKAECVQQFIKNAFKELFDRPPTEGVFRIPPQLDKQKAIMLKLEQAMYVNPKLLDTTLLCSCIKNCLRDLSEPLISIQIASSLRKSMNILFDKENFHFQNLFYILRQLNAISIIPEYKMNAKNLGIVFAPTVFKQYQLGDEKILSILIESAYQFQ